MMHLERDVKFGSVREDQDRRGWMPCSVCGPARVLPDNIGYIEALRNAPWMSGISADSVSRLFFTEEIH